jgi:Zn-dependent alcohol dehydrogenase
MLASHLGRGPAEAGTVLLRCPPAPGRPAPEGRCLADLIDRVLDRNIDPGKVIDLTLPLEQVAEGYRAMDERRAIRTLLRP